MNNNDKFAVEDVLLEEIGDGIDSGVVAEIPIKQGDAVKEGDTLVELETDKALLPVPSKLNGVVRDIFVEANATVKVGERLLAIEVGAPNQAPASPKSEATVSSPKPSVASSVPMPTPKAQEPKQPSTPLHEPAFEDTSTIAAGPATRKLARELGISLKEVRGTARGGRITLDDLKLHVKGLVVALPSVPTPNWLEQKPLPDLSGFGEVDIKKATHLRKRIADNVHRSWVQVPHVHQFQDIDVTELTALRKKHADEFREKGSTSSITPFLIKAMSESMKQFSNFNASYDAVKGEVVYKKYFNVGVAVDTPEGLIVPVLKNVDSMSVFQIGLSLKQLAKSARERRIALSDLKGASITLSNLGGIGGTYFTPIVNGPEVAILGVGRDAVKPIWNDDKNNWIPRNMLPVVLAYDHRIIDGADAARFIVHFTSLMEEPNHFSMEVENQ